MTAADTWPRQGLTTEAAARLLAEVGPNRLPDPPPRSVVRRAAEQLRDPMILLLLAAAALTAVLRDWANTVIIMAVVVFNTSAGVVQQVRAERAMAALHELVAPVTHVRRDGVVAVVPADEVVPGDLALVAAGDVVPADGDLIEASELQLDEARITGESLPVDREAGDEILGGTMVTHGHATLNVTRTGEESGIGRIAALLARTVPPRTPLQRRLASLSRVLVLAVVALTVVVMGIGLARGQALPEMLVVGLSLAVAAVPESLPAVVTVALAMGARRMAQQNAVVRSLPSVETLGSVTVVATDKTGTITEGTMLAELVWTPQGDYAVSGDGYEPVGTITARESGDEGADRALERLLRDVALCNDAELRRTGDGWTVIGDPLEGALLALATKGGFPVEQVTDKWPRIGEEPFDHRTRRMVTHHRGPAGERLSVCKGAPEAVLASLPGKGAAVRDAARVAGELASRGYRVIAVADSDNGQHRGLSLAGLAAIGDPPRAQASGVVNELQRAGIRLVLVTGDHPGTALAIARRVGIAGDDDHAVAGDELSGVHDRITVVARVRPEQKVGVVDALQRQGGVVAMLGDGVNDAPALRRADIGVAAGRGGTEVAKQASDLVLMDDDLGTVVVAVQEGRRIFANIRAFLTYAISGGLAEVGVMLGGSLIGLVLPLLPGQILWINLLTHGLVGVAFGAEPADPQDMTRPPRPASESIFTRQSKISLLVASVALTATALAAGAAAGGGDAERRTAIFLTLGLGQLGVALALRSASGSRRLQDWGLELGVLAALALLLLAVYAPGLNDVLGTRPVGAWTVAGAAVAAVIPGVLVRAVNRRTR